MIEQFASVVQRSSNPHPHQGKGVRKLSELFIQSLLGRHIAKQKETSQLFSFCYLKYSLFKVMQLHRDKPLWSYQYASQQDTGAAFKITFTASN